MRAIFQPKFWNIFEWWQSRRSRDCCSFLSEEMDPRDIRRVFRKPVDHRSAECYLENGNSAIKWLAIVVQHWVFTQKWKVYTVQYIVMKSLLKSLQVEDSHQVRDVRRIQTWNETLQFSDHLLRRRLYLLWHDTHSIWQQNTACVVCFRNNSQ